MTYRSESDPLDLLVRYAPTIATLDRDWDAARPADAVARIVAEDAVEPMRLMPRRPVARRRRLGSGIPVLASIGVFGAAAAVLAVVLVTSLTGGDVSGGGYDASAGGHGQPFDPPAGLSNQALGAKQYSYRVVEQLSLDAEGRRVTHGADDMLDRSYVSPKGDITSYRSGSQHGCFFFGAEHASFGSPDVAFLAKLPTDVGALTRYLRAHAQGSSSRDEAAFVAAGDMLTTADGLASPKLRAALVAVLSRTPGVHLHTGVRDDAQRPALRLDFVNQPIRPGQVQSLFFDPQNFRLLEQRDSSNGRPTTYSGPSPAYGSPAPANAKDSEPLVGPAFVQIMRSETVVDHLPAGACH